MIERTMNHGSADATAIRDLDSRDLAQIEGGWCGTPVPGQIPIGPTPGPNPWDFGQLGDLGRIGQVGMQR
jgi:hypothetical protein